ncbi:MAG TPA: MBL fold metallo-hydrolase, partial [Candidatus Limnocylindrales bacterium]
MRIADRIHRVGPDSIVNSYLVEESGEVTIIDAGAPGLWGLVPAELAAMGRSLQDVRAIVLTHGHTDHVGYAERARRERGWPVLVHEADELLAKRQAPNPAKQGRIRVRPLAGFTW